VVSHIDSEPEFGHFSLPMYAVIETGGKQYRVQPGTIVQVEKLEAEKGKSVSFDKVLFLSAQNQDAAQIWMGKPYVAGAKVHAEVVGAGRGEKVLIIKMKRRKQYRRTQGHRQEQMQLLVTSVENGAGGKEELSATDKKTLLAKFQSHLKPKGPASVKSLGLGGKKMAALNLQKKAAKAAAPKASKK